MLLRNFSDVTPETPILEGRSVYSLEPSNQQVSKMGTGFLCHELYFWHHVGKAAVYVPAGGMVEPDEHCESPESKRRFRNLLEASGQLDHLVQRRPELLLQQSKSMLQEHGSRTYWSMGHHRLVFVCSLSIRARRFET